MNDFLQMVLSMLGSSILKAVVFAVPVFGGMVYFHRRKHGKDAPFPWKRAILILLLVGYLVILDYATLSRLGGMGARGVNLRLFLAWREAWNNFSVKNWANVLLNVALFVPLGVLVPLVFPKCRGGLRMLAVALGATLVIETAQWLGGSGIFDVDDLFANTLGAMMGWCLLMAVLSAAGKHWGRGAAYGLLALIPAMAVGGIFLAYRMQPYGNLTQAPLYQVDTGDVEWQLQCELPEGRETAAVYQASPITVEECDAFGAEFARLTGANFSHVGYYDKETWFMDHGTNGWYHFLYVSYLDGSYEYEAGSQQAEPLDTQWAELDRAAAEERLAAYGIAVPSEAEFKTDGSWSCFEADRLVTAQGMLDGEIRCRFAHDGSKVEIENRLVTYSYCGDAAILSPEEACRQLCGGWFYSPWFEYRKPGEVSVRSCALGYETDTKGFYQPVYRFEVKAPEWDNADIILIPAIK